MEINLAKPILCSFVPKNDLSVKLWITHNHLWQKNPAIGRHWSSWPMPIIAFIGEEKIFKKFCNFSTEYICFLTCLTVFTCSMFCTFFDPLKKILQILGCLNFFLNFFYDKKKALRFFDCFKVFERLKVFTI